MKYTSPDGRTVDIQPKFGHALAALGWTTDEKIEAKTEVTTDAVRDPDPDGNHTPEGTEETPDTDRNDDGDQAVEIAEEPEAPEAPEKKRTTRRKATTDDE